VGLAETEGIIRDEFRLSIVDRVFLREGGD
jgi:hypothetical protein